jgi:RHS repeat-associated protein
LVDYNGSTGALEAWHVSGLGLDYIVSEEKPASGVRSSLVPDIQGSIIASVDSASGNLTKYGYRPFGLSPASGTPFGYTGAWFDQDSNLVNLRARVYSPQLGRFLQTDPIGVEGGSNIYAYVGNDPLNATDPTGLIFEGSKSGYRTATNDTDVSMITDFSKVNSSQKVGMVGGFVAGLAVGYAEEFSYGVLAYEVGSARVGRSASSLYDTTITRSRSKYLNVKTDVGATDFQKNLVSSGYGVVKQSPGTTILSNGTNTWTIYTRTSTQAPGAQFFGADGSIIKYSLGGP